jgi:hypothetical protein
MLFAIFFAFCSCYQDIYVTGDKPVPFHCNAQNFHPVTNISFASNLYRDTHNAQPALYPDGKNHAVPSLPVGRQGLHRDSFPARTTEVVQSGGLTKVPRLCPVLRQVTPTNFIARSLCVIPGTEIFSFINKLTVK